MGTCDIVKDDKVIPEISRIYKITIIIAQLTTEIKNHAPKAAAFPPANRPTIKAVISGITKNPIELIIAGNEKGPTDMASKEGTPVKLNILPKSMKRVMKGGKVIASNNIIPIAPRLVSAAKNELIVPVNKLINSENAKFNTMKISNPTPNPFPKLPMTILSINFSN